MAKVAHVRAAAAMLKKDGERVSDSRVAVITGLTRSEVRRLRTAKHGLQQWHRNRALRVLDGWRSDPSFRHRDGKPKDLTFQGREGSLARLTRLYAGDIPPRAILDELLKTKAIAKLANGRLRLIRLRAQSRAVSSAQVEEAFSRVSAVLETVSTNLMGENALLASTVHSALIDATTANHLQRYLDQRSKAFLEVIADRFTDTQKMKKGRRDRVRVGVSLFTHRG